MNERFNKMLKVILHNEGGYVNDPNDSGGETNYGISKRAFPYLDIKNITIEQVGEIYYKNYYLASRADAVDNNELAMQLFDHAVNAGVSKAIKLLQKCAGVVQDGIVGTITKGKVNSMDITNSYIKERKNFYMSISEGKNKKFLKGWLRRVDYTYEQSKKF